MSKESKPVTFELKKRRMRFLIGSMLAGAVLSPIAGPIIFKEESSNLNAPARLLYYIATPAVFGFLFISGVIQYRRFARQFEEEKPTGTKSPPHPK